MANDRNHPPSTDPIHPADRQTYDLIICGAGSVGLLSGLLAISLGFRTLIVEKHTSSYKHSRSIGIHPPSLQILSNMGILDRFLEHGMVITRGIAMENRDKHLGVLDFSTLPEPFNYILTVPQWKTEDILEEQIRHKNPEAIARGWTLTDLDHSENGSISVTIQSGNGDKVPLHAKYVMACDGKNSTVRRLVQIPFSGSPYRHRYAMGDFDDNTRFKSNAVVFLSPKGLVECFPLPGNLRRWVVQQDPAKPVNGTADLTSTIQNRTGFLPPSSTCAMFSEFGVERYVTDHFWKGRLIIAGDAAHVISPIGGQGMNLGWINATDAVHTIRKIKDSRQGMEAEMDDYNQRVQKRTHSVMRQAEFNMSLSSRQPFASFRNFWVKVLLHSPAQTFLKKRFTMQRHMEQKSRI